MDDDTKKFIIVIIILGTVSWILFFSPISDQGKVWKFCKEKGFTSGHWHQAHGISCEKTVWNEVCYSEGYCRNEFSHIVKHFSQMNKEEAWEIMPQTKFYKDKTFYLILIICLTFFFIFAATFYTILNLNRNLFPITDPHWIPILGILFLATVIAPLIASRNIEEEEQNE